MPIYQAVVTIGMTSNMPEDAATNSFWTNSATGPDAINFCDEIETFYGAIGSLYSNLVDPAGFRLDLYDLSQPLPRFPVYDKVFSPITVGGAPLPPEVALCMSFKAQPATGTNPARRRGRVYIGPLAVSTLGPDGRPTSATVSQLVNAGDALRQFSSTTPNSRWAIYSRVNQTTSTVASGWVDDEYDTQRRRGRAALTRSTF